MCPPPDAVADVPPWPEASPVRGECVVCFVDRMTREYGCNGKLLWTRLWRARCAPRATALERRLGSKGGYCDCEVLVNAYVRRDLFAPGPPYGMRDEERERLEQKPKPPCLGVGRGSSKCCALWYARRRGYLASHPSGHARRPRDGPS